MRKVFAGGVVAVAGLVMSASAFAAVRGTDRPFRITARGTSTVNLATGRNEIALTGHGTHVGKFRQTEHAQLIPIAPGLLSFHSNWEAIGASGAQMSGACSGLTTTDDFVHFLVQLDCAPTPGTGRFSDVTGSFHVTVHVTRLSVEGTTAHNLAEVSGRGTISY